MRRILSTAGTVAMAAALLQSQNTKEKVKPFEITETTIDQIHAAYKSGELTAHQIGPGLSGPHPRLRPAGA